jgi:hypothetical protein
MTENQKRIIEAVELASAGMITATELIEKLQTISETKFLTEVTEME